jgi:hypothetical protein
MSFLGEPFKHDLFVSYSHGAFAGNHDADLKLWSQTFAEDLRKELARAIEFENVSVFLDESDRHDESIDRAAGLTEQLRRRVHNSALLTVLITSHYLRSNWCRDERDWWCGKHHPDTLGTDGRILVCRVWPTEEADWPVELCDERRVPLPGYHCYDRNKHPDTARPFGWRGYARDRDDYIDLLVELSGDVMQRLRAIKVALEQHRQRDEAAARLAADGGQVIYLHAREAHAKAWERASDSLGQNGFVVLPSEPDPIAREPKAIREIAERRVENHERLRRGPAARNQGWSRPRCRSRRCRAPGPKFGTRHNRPASAVRRARYRGRRGRHGKAQSNGARARDRLD